MVNEKKEVIRKGYQPNKERLKNENAPKGRKITAAVQPKDNKQGKPK